MLFSLRTSFKATLVNDDGTPRITAEVRNVTPDDIGKVAELVRDVFGTPSGTCRSDSAARGDRQDVNAGWLTRL
ncbi:TPA: hypothetical protein JTP90_004739 [Escherichia coli]|uniref:hypothetical protein n=1 Tax=Escherichia coli TaxID=562 RepID=UPI001BE21590|nr:hypothetical protein [Escherichia coli]EIY9046642.1 hypothetical protein [Escherichia coli]EJB8795725.1 hypothetical protein [Escherichia coli]EKG1438775.1 hypothetical protein [Escherichia coli]EKG5178727.1 hypothetical protein [Escherichia coli]HAX6830899.1 hypothetical protein [Escherichia coli]